MRKFKEQFGRVLRSKMDEKRLNQRQLAEKIGVEPPSVNRWVKGKSYPDAHHLQALNKALGTDLDLEMLKTAQLPKALEPKRRINIQNPTLLDACVILGLFQNAQLDMRKLAVGLLTEDWDLVDEVARRFPELEALFLRGLKEA